jgi:hypothetical protein
MQKKKYPGRLLLITFLVLISYFFLFPYPLGRELHLKPVWAKELRAGNFIGKSENQPFTWLKTGDFFAYFNLAGDFYYVGRVFFDVALSNSGFVNFAKITENLVFIDNRGRFLFSFESYGYPLLSDQGERIFTVNTDLCGIRELNREGELLWQKEFATPITTLSIKEDYLLLGLLEGRFELLDRQGMLEFEFTPTGSRIETIFGVAQMQGRLAVISGIDPQQLSVFEEKDQSFTPVFSCNLDTDYRREVMIDFSGDGRYLILEGSNGVSVLDMNNRRSYSLPTSGRLKYFSTADEIMITLSEIRGSTIFQVSGFPNQLLYSELISTEDVFLRQIDEHLFLAINGHLVRIDVLEG